MLKTRESPQGRKGYVVADELPRDRSTLLVRIMAAGPVLADAIADLAALPLDAHERAVAEHPGTPAPRARKEAEPDP